MKYCALTDRKFKVAIIQRFNELQDNSERQFNELKNKIHEQKTLLTTEIEILNKNQILEMKIQ